MKNFIKRIKEYYKPYSGFDVNLIKVSFVSSAVGSFFWVFSVVFNSMFLVNAGISIVICAMYICLVFLPTELLRLSVSCHLFLFFLFYFFLIIFIIHFIVYSGV
jgi:hypothetical protein